MGCGDRPLATGAGRDNRQSMNGERVSSGGFPLTVVSLSVLMFLVLLSLGGAMVAMYLSAAQELRRSLGFRMEGITAAATRLIEPAIEREGGGEELVPLLRRLRDAHELDHVLLLDGDRLIVADAADTEAGTPASLFAAGPRLSPGEVHLTVGGVPTRRSVTRIPRDEGAWFLVVDRADPLPVALAGLRRGLAAGVATALIGVLALAFASAVVLRWHRRARVRLEAMTTRARAGTLASTLAHEVRNPMSTALTAARLLRKEGGDPARREALVDAVAGGIREASDQLEGFLDLTRELPLRRRTCDLREVVEGAVDLVEPRIREAGIDVVREFPSTPLTVPVDRRRLGQAVLNLLLNACEAIEGAGRRGHIVCRLSKGEEEVVCAVEDDGPGIDEGMRRYVGDPFATDKPGGTGLGLAVVRRTAELHGGSFALRDRDGGGTIAEISLPIGAPDADPAG